VTLETIIYFSKAIQKYWY